MFPLEYNRRMPSLHLPPSKYVQRAPLCGWLKIIIKCVLGWRGRTTI